LRDVSDTPPPSPEDYEPPGPGYWKASDGEWYPPELHPSRGGAAIGQGQYSTGYRPGILPAGTRLSSLAKRFGGSLLSLLLVIVTLGIGYMIWALIVYGQGQTPAKQLLNMYVIDERTGQVASWGTMFVRGFVIDGLVGLFTLGLFDLVSALWIFSGDRRQRLTDKMVNTIVVDAPGGLRV
jgi:uncharacterized RDD family membrane protein YckC